MICVVGDVIKDIYNYGRVRGVSAESPTLVMERQFRKEFWGGAALVHRHIENLGEESLLMTMSEVISDLDSCIEFPHGDFDISTKERFFVDGYKLFQIDELNKGKHTSESRDEFADYLWSYNRFPKFDCLVMSDNRHGVFDRELVDRILRHEERDLRLYTIVDSQVSQNQTNIDWYRNRDVKLFMFNKKELEAALNMFQLPLDVDESWDVLEKLSLKLNHELYKPDIVVKLGERGSIAYVDGKYYRHWPAKMNSPIVDTCGAGDAFLAVCAVTKLKNPDEDLQKANDYAALSCTYIGTEVPR